MNIKDLLRKPLPPKYLDDGETINLAWLYEVISSYEERGTVGAVLERGYWNENEAKITKEIYLEEASINIFNLSETVVVQADFAPDFKPVFTHASNLCKEWINFMPEERREFLNLTLIPLIFECQLIINLTNMIYYDAQFNSGNLRLIMVFSMTEANVSISEDVNFEELSAQAEREVLSEIKKIEEENYALYKEIEDMKKNHSFEDKVRADLNDIADPTAKILDESRNKKEKRENNPFKRIVKDFGEDSGEGEE